MNEKDYTLARIIYLKEQIKIWTTWHCSNYNCKHPMCIFRNNTLDDLYRELYEFQNYLEILHDRDRLRV